MLKSEIITVLAKGVADRYRNPTKYARMRSKITKNNFSEVALYSAMADHCEENDIEPRKMIESMYDLLEGITMNAFFIKTSNEFSWLRASFHDVQHGDLTKGEPKSPEQRGKFLCNQCFIVLDKKDLNPNKNTPFTCRACIRKTSLKNYHKKKKAQEQQDQHFETLQKTAPAATIDEKPAPSAPEPTQTTIRVPAPSYPVGATFMSEETPKEKFTVVTRGADSSHQSSIEITDILAEGQIANLTLTCAVDELHILLGAIQNAKRGVM